MKKKDLAVHIRDLSKVYHYNPKLNQNVREMMFETKNLPRSKEIVALKNVNIDLETGSVLGIIGDNGSGKSTLLKLISGITKPTSGIIEINGRVASILEVGTGFHPDLTGKENIFLSGALMGMGRAEINSKFKTIVDFSEIGNYIDLAVKHYSSGMFMRLAFSVVAHLNSDIILLDEVFSVGDFTFRQKSLEKVIELSKSDRTLVLVSHDLHSLERACDHILELEEGHMVNFGPVAEVVSKYVETKILSTIEEEDQDEIDGKGQNEGSTDGETEESEENTLSSGEEVATAHSGDFKRKESLEVTHLKIKYTDEFTKLRHDHDNLKKELLAIKRRKKAMPRKFSPVKKWAKGLRGKDDESVIVYELSCLASLSKPPVYEFEDELTMYCEFEKKFKGKMGIAFLVMYNLENQVFAAYSGYSRNKIDIKAFNDKGRYNVSCIIPSQMFNSGIYSISVFFIDDQLQEKFSLVNKVFFKIAAKENIEEKNLDNGKYNGALKPSFDWKIKSGAKT